MKYLLKNGTFVSGDQMKKADVLIENEKIAKTGPDLNDPEAVVIDVTGKLLFPGFIDAHTHFQLEVAGTVTADNFDTGTRAAIKGGTTTVIDFATQYKGETLEKALENWHMRADGRSSCVKIICPIPTAPAVASAYYKKNGIFEQKLPLKNTPYARKKKS